MDTAPVSFVITAWLEPRQGEQPAEWRYHVRHVQSGQEARFAHLQAVLGFLAEKAGVPLPVVASEEDRQVGPGEKGSHMSNNGPLASLSAEHEVALDILDRLQAAVESLATGSPLSQHLAVLAEVAHFLTVDLAQHIRQEEDALFPLLEEVMGAGAGPPAVMRMEHQELSEHIGPFQDYVSGWAAAGSAPPAEVAQGKDVAYHIIGLLRQHIAKEEEVLFPMTRRMLSPEQIRVVAQKMAELGAQVG
ncbi:MAG: hemerythrin domain-containing protein [Chloroflexota bacterium]|nr:hemerythrin domain-containing protein [Chloroflexota bacterium]